MGFLDGMERKFGKLGIPRLTQALVIGQAFFYLASYILRMVDPSLIVLYWPNVLRGEVWRVVSFLFTPPSSNPLFAFFGLYLLLLMGNTLEHQWGEFKFTVYVAFTAALIILTTILFPWVVGVSYPIELAIFLGFAYLFPDFELRMFFFLPVKVKWLAALAAAVQIYLLFMGDWGAKAMVIASFASFILFFLPNWLSSVRSLRRRRMHTVALESSKPVHACAVCGKSKDEYPHLDMRYCTDCSPPKCFCPDHIDGHDHVVSGR